MTEMELSEEDVERLERIGYSGEEFSLVGEEGIPLLRNVGKWCYFYYSSNRLCRVYTNRPIGCRLYPIVYSIDELVTVDPLCPMALTMCQDELIAKGSELIKFVKKLENEAVARRVGRETKERESIPFSRAKPRK